MNMIITLKSINKGVFKIMVYPENQKPYMKDFSAEGLHDFLTAVDFSCESTGSKYKFVVPNHIKKVVGNWLESLQQHHNN